MKKIEIDVDPFLRFGKTFFTSFGILWFFIEIMSFVFEDIIKKTPCNSRICTLIVIMFLSVIISLFLNREKKYAKKKLKAPECSIEIKIGDLFLESNSLVVGFSDCFDTEIGEVIKQKSVQGQFQEKFYENNTLALDNEIDAVLSSKNLPTEPRKNKVAGKKIAYPVGTTISLGVPGKRYFLCAYTQMGDDCKAYSNFDFLVTSLHNIWHEIRVNGQGNTVSMPVIGSDLARTNIPRMALIKFIIMSFIFKSKEESITKKLNIIIHPNDKEHIDMLELQSFLDEIVY